MKLLVCFLILGSLICAATAFPHIPTFKKEVPQQCGDPTFACQDLESARLCGVVKTCIHDIWSTMSVPDDNDEVCDICKEMVKEARDQLLSNMTQEEIKEVFEGSCKLLPIKIVAEGCIKVVDEIIPELVEMLASRMDPTMVCTISGMCFPSQTTKENRLFKLIQIILAKDKTSKCDQCTSLIKDAQEFIKSSSLDEVKTYIEKFCDEKMPSYLCNALTNHYLPDIYNYLKNTPAVEVCSSVGICPKQCQLEHDSKVKDDLECEFCEHVLQHVKDLITANTTAEEFRTALLNFCKHVGKFSDKCTSIVNDYYDMLFDYIRKINTKGMCTLMGLCGNTACSKIMPMVKLIPALEAGHKIPLIKLQPAHEVQSKEFIPMIKLIPATALTKNEIKESNDIFQPMLPLKFVHPMTIFEKDTECALCKAFSFYLEKDLDGDKSKDGVRSAINGICDKWMTEYPDYCAQIIEKYSIKMQYAIAKGEDFGNLCFHVKACPLEQKESVPMMKLKLVHKAGPFCDLCKDAMNEVEKQLSDPAMKQKLKDLADQGCNVLPKQLRDDCVNFINQNIDAVIDILQQELKPDNICPALGLCAGAPRILAPPRVKDLECDVCKDVVSSFRQRLQDPASKEIVLTFLEEGCARLPTSVASECRKFVDEEIDTLMKIIIQEMDPNSVCALLSICPAKEMPKQVNDLECELCKEVVTKVLDMIKDKKTEDEIKSALDKVCSYLPSSMANKCENFVNQYTDLLIILLSQELDPATVCAMLKVCPASVVEKQSPKRVHDMECDLCKEVVTKVEEMIKDKKTEDEIKTALDKVCTYLPSSMATKCENFVNQYVETLILLITQELDPAMVCSLVKACPSSSKVEMPKKVNNLECDLCKELVGEMENMMKDKKTQDEIQNALDKVCSYLPSKIAKKCESFVNKYAELLITIFSNEMDPTMVCAALNVCPTVENPSETQLKSYQKAKDVECEGCQYALHFIQTELMDSSTQDEVKNTLKKVCSLLPTETFIKNCEAFVDEYGSSLLVLIAQEIDPSKMCYQLQMCSNQTNILKREEIVLKRFHVDECSVCTAVVDYLDKILEEDDVDKEITHVIEQVCTVLPSSFRDKCATMLEAYGPYLLQMIGQLADSKQVCQDIDMCARSPTSVHLIGGSKCTFGPSYWCKSVAHAAACKAEEFCKSNNMLKN